MPAFEGMSGRKATLHDQVWVSKVLPKMAKIFGNDFEYDPVRSVFHNPNTGEVVSRERMADPSVQQMIVGMVTGLTSGSKARSLAGKTPGDDKSHLGRLEEDYRIKERNYMGMVSMGVSGEALKFLEKGMERTHEEIKAYIDKSTMSASEYAEHQAKMANYALESKKISMQILKIKDEIPEMTYPDKKEIDRLNEMIVNGNEKLFELSTVPLAEGETNKASRMGQIQDVKNQMQEWGNQINSISDRYKSRIGVRGMEGKKKGFDIADALYPPGFFTQGQGPVRGPQTKGEEGIGAWSEAAGKIHAQNKAIHTLKAVFKEKGINSPEAMNVVRAGYGSKKKEDKLVVQKALADFRLEEMPGQQFEEWADGKLREMMASQGEAGAKRYLKQMESEALGPKGDLGIEETIANVKKFGSLVKAFARLNIEGLAIWKRQLEKMTEALGEMLIKPLAESNWGKKNQKYDTNIGAMY